VLPIDYDDLSLIALEPEPRAGVAAPLLERFIRMTFRHRHSRLRRHFGA
jgi:hypothetical protein